MKLSHYRKLFVAILGITALIAMRHFEIEIPGIDSLVLELIIGALSSFGVYQAANEPMPPPPSDEPFTGGEV